MDVNPTRRDYVTYTTPCIPHSNELEKLQNRSTILSLLSYLNVVANKTNTQLTIKLSFLSWKPKLLWSDISMCVKYLCESVTMTISLNFPQHKYYCYSVAWKCDGGLKFGGLTVELPWKPLKSAIFIVLWYHTELNCQISSRQYFLHDDLGILRHSDSDLQ